jgi:hypothetical protein
VLPGSLFGFLRHYPSEIKRNTSRSITTVNGIQISNTIHNFLSLTSYIKTVQLSATSETISIQGKEKKLKYCNHEEHSATASSSDYSWNLI